MTRKVICDGCGDTDDWGMSGKPFFPDGLLLQFRTSSGGTEIDTEMELCVECKADLLKAMPALVKVLEERE